MPELERQFLSPSEIAKLTGVDAAVIRKAINDGELPALRVSPAKNAKMRVYIEDLWTWIRAKQEETRQELARQRAQEQQQSQRMPLTDQ